MALTNSSIKIGEKLVGPKEATFFIAEIGNNHNGDFSRALKLVDLAVDMGADCAKFQLRDLEDLYRKKSLSKTGDDLGTEYTIDLLRRFELSIDQHIELAAYCKRKGILYLCTPWDRKSVAVLEKIGVPAFKVASADLTNLPLLETLVATGKPLILSTGMSEESEIVQITEFLKSKNAAFALLHCNSTYPAPFHNINLNYLKRLQEIYPIVGYSGHERGTAVSMAAIALGARIIERHFTLDRNMEGPDHAASLEFKDFKNLIEGVRQIESSLGEGHARTMSQGEMINRENLGKSLVAARTLKKGAVVQKSDVEVKSPGRGVSPLYLNQLIGRTLEREIEAEDFFYMSDIQTEKTRLRNFKFKRPWGIPVRYYDFDFFRAKVTPDLFEFHLSYSDMNLKLDDFFKGTYQYDFIVHAPELFEGSHLMDLATPDTEYRLRSLQETQRVIDITKSLKKYFPKTKRPMIVANVGGFSMDAPLDPKLKRSYYERFAQSLRELNLEGVELIPQTMAPFPWHFGGQRYQNIFVNHLEIAEVCKEFNLRMCFDVSHSALTCNHFKIEFNEFLKTVGPYTAHLHLGDARGLDGEGLQVGDGDLDFNQMAHTLAATCPNAPFIPEIWQGHKNNGEGFWIALDKLENIF